jgi:hypothetical protein
MLADELPCSQEPRNDELSFLNRRSHERSGFNIKIEKNYVAEKNS